MNDNLYKAMKDRQQAESNTFFNQYGFFAFSKEQFGDGLRKLGLTEAETYKLYYLGFSGGYILKDHVSNMRAMFDRFAKERADAIADPEHGPRFAYDMFVHELFNHEYGYTGEAQEALETLGYDWEDIGESPLLMAFNEAKRYVMEHTER